MTAELQKALETIMKPGFGEREPMNSAVHRNADSEMSRDRIDAFAAYDLAISLAYQAGFTKALVSMKTESCYFTHAGRPGVLMRLSMHKNSRSPMGMNNVVARASFAPTNTHLTQYMVWNTMRFVIGDYFMRPIPPSKYRGKRGTWEDQSPSTVTSSAGG